jgi:heavy metal translocating P-type ATPase
MIARTFAAGGRLTPILTAAGLVAGLVAWALGYPGIAAAAWAATTALALLPLGYGVISGLLRRRAGVDVIALLAMAGALVLHQYLAGAVIALMLSGGKALEAFADSRARRELSALLRRVPRTVHRFEGDSVVAVPIELAKPGDLLLIKPGEVVPVDGIVIGETAVLDEAALTGEANPVEHKPGEPVRSGATNASRAPFRMRAGATAEESTYAGIIRLVRQAQESKAPLVRLADRYAMFFLPLTLAVSGLAWAISGDPVRALAVLVVATPCPLILAAPIAIVAGISRAARLGIIIKGGGALETLARGKTLILDKTGTVTAGSPSLTTIETFGSYSPDRLLQLAASLDQASPHVLAVPILKAAAERAMDLPFPSGIVEEFGSGIRGLVDGVQVRLGKSEWLLRGATPSAAVRRLRRLTTLEGSSGVFIAVDGTIEGALILQDAIRPDAPLTIRALRRAGFDPIIMLTGDRADVAELVGGVLGVSQVLAERSPAEKEEAVRAEQHRAVTVMVGDGINDAPALAAADVGVAMGARGATASSEAADVVLVADRLDKLLEAFGIARRSRSIALESILAGMGLSIAAMICAANGLLSPVAGAVLQEGIDVAVIANAMRALGRERRRAPSQGLKPVTSERCRAEHRELLPGITRIRHTADRLDLLSPTQARAELEEIHRFLMTKVLPHDEAEDTDVYPAVAKLIGGDDPTAPMNRAHIEIAHMARMLGRNLADLPPEGPGPEDIREVRRILYGLDAILRLHFAQEEEAYLALIDARSPERRDEI